MTRIAFIGLGNMGGGMAANQAKAGREVLAFDLSEAALDKAVGARLPAGRLGGRGGEGRRRGRSPCCRPARTCARSMPNRSCRTRPSRRAADRLLDHRRGERPRRGRPGQGGGLPLRRRAGLRRHGGGRGRDAGLHGRLRRGRFRRRSRRRSSRWRGSTIRAGDHGAGQAAKICNNMVLGISMIGGLRGLRAGREAGPGSRRSSSRSPRSPPASAGA